MKKRFVFVLSLVLVVCLLSTGTGFAKVTKAKSVTLNIKEATIGVGSTVTLQVTEKPAKANEPVKWISSDKTIATVSKSGVVTGISEGDAVITVKTTKSKKSARANIKVEKYLTTNEAQGLIKDSMIDEAGILDLIKKNTISQDNVLEMIKGNTLTNADVITMIKENTLSQENVLDLIKKNTLTNGDVLAIIKENTINQDGVLNLIKGNTLSEDNVLELIKNNTLSKENVIDLIKANTLSQEDVLALIKENTLSEEDVVTLIHENEVEAPDSTDWEDGTELKPYNGQTLPITLPIMSSNADYGSVVITDITIKKYHSKEPVDTGYYPIQYEYEVKGTVPSIMPTGWSILTQLFTSDLTSSEWGAGISYYRGEIDCGEINNNEFVVKKTIFSPLDMSVYLIKGIDDAWDD